MNLKPVTQLVDLTEHDLNGYSDEAQARKESFHRTARLRDVAGITGHHLAAA